MDDSIPLNFHKCAEEELENSPKVILFEKCKKMTSDLHSAKLEYVKSELSYSFGKMKIEN